MGPPLVVLGGSIYSLNAPTHSSSLVKARAQRSHHHRPCLTVAPPPHRPACTTPTGVTPSLHIEGGKGSAADDIDKMIESIKSPKSKKATSPKTPTKSTKKGAAVCGSTIKKQKAMKCGKDATNL